MTRDIGVEQGPLPKEVQSMSETIPRMVLRQATRLAGRTALRRKEAGAWRDITWAELAANLRAFGRGLLALGAAPGDRVAIMAPNGPEWAYADLGSMACGAVSVPVYHTEGVEALLHILRDSGSRFLFLHSPLLAGELAAHLPGLASLEGVILLDGGAQGERFLTLEAFLQGAAAIPESALNVRLEEGSETGLATIVYTSGTTGAPKGVMLTHANFLSNIRACIRLFDIGEADRCLSFLPLSHVFERMAGYYLMLHQGATIAYAESIDSVPANLLEVRPTVLISVPRLYEKMYARVMERALAGSWLKKQAFFTALAACRGELARAQAGERRGGALRLAAAAARKLVFAPLREHLGGRLRFFVSGGAPLGPPIAEFFMAVGLPIYEGYGLSETSPVVAVNHPGATRLGTVGRPISGVEVRIAGDGEILVRGPGVFQGYWQQPEATAEAFADGWLRTGDVGRVDDDGFLAITDRKKDIIVTAGGKNIAPQNLENLFKTSKYLANALVYGDRKPYLTALLVPNFENLEKFARSRQIDFINHCDLVNHPEVLALVRDQVDHLQHGLPSFQHIKRFTLLNRDFSREGGEVTPTLKVKRNVVARRFQHLLEGMYLAEDHGIHDSGFCVVEENDTPAQG
jgi:long-chain acyl-CoA synthetase